MGDRAQPHFTGANSSAHGARKHAANSAAPAKQSINALEDQAAGSFVPDGLEVFQSVVKPQTGKDQKQRSGGNAAGHEWPRECLDLRDQLSLFPSHVFLGSVEKNLIVFMASKKAPPN